MIFKPRLISSDTPLTHDELLSIKEGDLVKLCNGTDNIWSQIVDVKTRGYFDGIVSSRLNEKSYNFGDLIRFHKKHKKLATVLAVTPPSRFGSLLVKKNNVKKFDEKPINLNNWINGGFFVLSKKVIKFLKNDKTVWEKEPLEKIAKRKQLVAFKHKDFWAAMDTLREKNFLEKLWKKKQAPWKIWK